MLIAILNGSPNKDGNTMFLLNKISAKIKELGAEVEVIRAGEAVLSSKIPFCTVCSNPCNGKCFKDTQLEQSFETLTKADGIIIGSPVYFGTVSAQIKAFFDKTRSIRSQKAWINKPAAGVTVGGSRFGGQETTLKALHDIMLVHGMIIIGDGHVDKDAGHHGVCAQRNSENDTFAINRAEVLAKRMVQVCKATQLLRND